MGRVFCDWLVSSSAVRSISVPLWLWTRGRVESKPAVIASMEPKVAYDWYSITFTIGMARRRM